MTGSPIASLFAPTESEAREPGEVALALDELEAIRLADVDGLKQEEAAQEMQISRPTFGRVLESAHRKVADALVHGRSLRIEGGTVCTLEGPRDCPRWRRGDPTECTAPCGRTFVKAHKEVSAADCGSHQSCKKEKRS